MNHIITSKAEILAMCRTLAVQDGLQSLNMRNVAAACGVSVGCVYTYFPSKTDLVVATVEDIWKTVFSMDCCQAEHAGFLSAVDWFYRTALAGSSEYPMFFQSHSILFAGAGKASGRNVMHQHFAHMKQGLLTALQNDPKVRPDAFSDIFTPNAFVDFVFENVLRALTRHDDSYQILTEMVHRSLY